MAYTYRKNGKNHYHYHRPDYVGRDYEERDDARTFRGEDKFFYINFVDCFGRFDSKYSIMVEGRQYAVNKAKWLARRENWWAHKEVNYPVDSIGVYDSHQGHIYSYECA